MTFEFRVKMPNGSEQTVVAEGKNRREAESNAEDNTGGKVLGGRQLSN